ncbi:MAG: hypothetical protein HC869_01735 [Rhodospirillales bacterium]|nr:hypothetical protein [Rhodospirillales bacterium]
MPTYHCYVLDKADKISYRREIVAEDDLTAFVLAAESMRTWQLYPVIEVWQGTRLVGRVPQRDGKD